MNSNFIRWYFNTFRMDPLFLRMSYIVEGSPWHREQNVGVHTDMVVAEYLSLAGELDAESVLGALAAVFHDVGKPISCVKNGIQHKPERGDYLSFSGHEMISAREWENYAAINWNTLVKTFPTLIPSDITTISWMIEFHLPWGIVKPWKLDHLAITANQVTDLDVFTNVLLADTFGRISDDASEKRAKSKDWVSNFKHRMFDLPTHQTSNEEEKPVFLVPIGASGSGKTTFRQQLDSDMEIFSNDDLYVEWYSKDYNEAFNMMTKDRKFDSKLKARFRERISTHKSIFFDRTNTSRKVRKYFIDLARKEGYFIEAVMVPVALQTVIDRQSSRTDKSVPTDVVVRQYRGTQMPQYGEFDSIITLGNNL